MPICGIAYLSGLICAALFWRCSNFRLMAQSAETPLTPRDISWLHFNHRVLQEAADPCNPLYDRLRFLAIYSSNLDEFYRVRVAALRSFRKVAKADRKDWHIALRPRRVLREIKQMVKAQQAEFGAIFRTGILPGLAEQGIYLRKPAEFTPQQVEWAFAFYFRDLAPHIKVLNIGPAEGTPFLENQALYLAFHAGGEAVLSLVKIPVSHFPRFIALPASAEGAHEWAFLDDMVRHGLGQQFGLPGSAFYALKLSRDADLYLEDEYGEDIVEKIRRSLGKREVGAPTRLLYDDRMPKPMRQQLKACFGLSKYDMVPGAPYHNFHDFADFPLPDGMAGLQRETLPPLPHPKLQLTASLIDEVLEADQFLHFPYHDYRAVPALIREAARRPEVAYIKITLYRAADRSAVISALQQALSNGKRVVAFIEAKARFDEAANLHWGEQLEEQGAEVRYNIPGLKVHTKLLLIGLKSSEGLRHLAYLGTGNFNEKTARFYTDFALMTADARLADEVALLFAFLEGRREDLPFRHLMAAPSNLRASLFRLIEQETAQARAGGEAWIFLKMNNLEDAAIIRKLYEACEAGVKVRMIVRGICRAVAGPEGAGENMQIISVVDRYLEHARAYIFANGGRPKTFLASADWMTRNLDHRVEVAFPLYDEEIAAEVRKVMELQWADPLKARCIEGLSPDNRYMRRTLREPTSQEAIYQRMKAALAITPVL